MNINVSSETSLLQSVIVHTPGKEVNLVGPEIKDELLFDDIIFEQDAREEHKDMLEIFRTIMPDEGQILQIADLILECFHDGEARSFFIEHLIKRLPEMNLQAIEKDLRWLDAQSLYEFAVCGETGALRSFKLLPSPNIMFTRDLAAVINNGIIISRAAKKARIRESLLMETLVAYHPLFETVKHNAFRLAHYDSIEGGDIVVVSDKVVVIGMSERTSFSGIMKAAGAIFDFGVEKVLIVDIPKQRSSMHLDTIFTFLNDDECLVYEPAVSERSDNVVCLSRAEYQFATYPKKSLKEALEELLERKLTFINCGGKERINQNREQWTDGANMFAIAPGVVIGYERNTHTFEALEEHGYKIMTQYEFIDAYKNQKFIPSNDTRIAISFVGNELCRGRGGARCMTMPLSRA